VRLLQGDPLSIALSLILLGSLAGSATAAPHRDPELYQGYKDMYNLAFDEAHQCFQKWESSHPNDPMGPASDAAAYLFSEFDRLRILQSEFFMDNNSFFHRRSGAPDPEIQKKFETALADTKRLADAKLQASPDDHDALFATILRLGLHADYLALIQRRYLASLDDVKQSRTSAEHLLSICSSCYDAYLAIGVENYLLSLKPAPIRWLLRAGGAQTDKETGIKNLRLTAANGYYLQPYADLLLAVAALRDKNQGEAKRLLSSLSAQFPDNVLYREELKKLH
jgi:hypothetical protein